MGFRIGKRVGNTYISTNGRNVRTTTRIGKNTYYTHHFGYKRSRYTRKNNSVDIFGAFIGLLTIIVIVAPFINSKLWIWYALFNAGGFLGIEVSKGKECRNVYKIIICVISILTLCLKIWGLI